MSSRPRLTGFISADALASSASSEIQKISKPRGGDGSSRIYSERILDSVFPFHFAGFAQRVPDTLGK